MGAEKSTLLDVMLTPPGTQHPAYLPVVEVAVQRRLGSVSLGFVEEFVARCAEHHQVVDALVAVPPSPYRS